MKGKQKKEEEQILERKKLLFIDDLIIYIENPKESSKNQTRTNKKMYQGFRIQSEYAKSIAFVYVINKQLENKI